VRFPQRKERRRRYCEKAAAPQMTRQAKKQMLIVSHSPSSSCFLGCMFFWLSLPLFFCLTFSTQGGFTQSLSNASLYFLATDSDALDEEGKAKREAKAKAQKTHGSKLPKYIFNQSSIDER
jgi:hypothetical protein